MPHIPLVVSDGVHKDAIRVLITGFEPFANYKINPSWLAARPLHNVLLEASSPSEPVKLENQQVLTDPDDVRPIHITSLLVPVTYDGVLSIVPKLHTRPPLLPSPLNDDPELESFPIGPDPPADGYDLILHVGAGMTGNLRVEKLGHKLGYNVPDVDKKYAPVVHENDERGDKDKKAGGLDTAEVFERGRVTLGTKDESVRGFAQGYESFAEELKTDIDVDALVQELRDSGVDAVQASTNAGRYLCDFIYYCSLAEAQRTLEKESGKATKVLFVHCPPVGEPLSTEYVTEALKRIVASICRRLSSNF
ncbi:hypothetical protein ACEPAI_8196 [Sanghuangporus weigelae]